MPELGVSSRPRMARRVVFPEPEGPTMATHSPWCTVMCTLDRAWVSTSSVRKTFVTPSRWSNRCPAAGRASWVTAWTAVSFI